MATSKSFFGLRKGSTKSHTFQVYRGQQVTKDRVTDVSNPQSEKQMAQRLKLVSVASLAAQLSSIFDHSFQSIEYGYKSIAEFRRLNLAKNSLQLYSFVPKGFANAGVGDFVLSAGSLTPYVHSFKDDQVVLDSAVLGSFTSDYLKGDDVEQDQKSKVVVSDDNIAKICAALGIEVGDQLTFILGVSSSDWEVPIGDGSASFYPTRYIVSRLVTDINDEDCLKGWRGGTNNLDNGLISIFFDSDSKPYIQIAPQGMASDFLGQYLVFQLPTSWKTENMMIMEAAVIVSRKNGSTYQRSRENFDVNPSDNAKAYWTPYGIAEPTYLKSTGASDKYLNSGSDVVADTYEV